jgi:hypothetical protein
MLVLLLTLRPNTVSPNYVIGETFTYNLTTTFIKGTTTPAIAIQMPVTPTNDSLCIVSIDALFIGAQITGANITIALLNTNPNAGDPTYDQALISFDTFVNLPGGLARDNLIVFSLTGMFHDSPQMIDGVQLPWTSQLRVPSATITRTTNLIFRNPKLSSV